MWVGIDFGTTNSGIAVYDGQKVHLLDIDPAATNPRVIRTVLYLTRDGDHYIGREAITTYYEQNIGRARSLVKKWIGEIEITAAEVGTFIRDVYVDVDELEPGRLMHSLKSALASSFESTSVFEQDRTLEDLIATYLRSIRVRAESALGESVDQVLLGRPVHFAGAKTAADDIRAQDRLHEAARQAGFKDVAFEFEPIAAAYDYALRLEKKQNILVFDFGGGTLDLTVMTVGGESAPAVLANGGIDIAGDLFDRRILRSSVLHHFGEGTTWGGQALRFPASIIDALTEWEGIPSLATPQTRQFLNRVQSNCSHSARIYALESLITNNYGYALFDTVEQAKQRLSEEHFVVIAFKGTDIEVWQPTTRSQFEACIRAEARAIEECVVDTVERSGLSAADIDAVIRTGGSSSIPYFVAMLERLVGAEKLEVEDVFSGVTSGLSIRAHQLELARSRS